MAYLRFVIDEKDRHSGRRKGLFQVFFGMQRSGALLPHELDAWRRAYEWLAANLEEPDRFARASRPHPKKVALSWFKDTATEHLEHMRHLSAILLEHGIDVVVLRTERPGYIVYEDEHQVVAEPFADTPT